MLTDKIQTRILVILIAIGSFLRIYQIGFQCYWLEEIYTLNMANNTFFEIFKLSTSLDYNPPLYYLFAHAALMISGYADVAIRHPSMICGILLIPAMFYLGNTYKNQMTGLYCAGITAILYPLVYYSQYGRAYSMSFLFFVLTLIVYIRIKDGDHSNSSKVLFGILFALNGWTHLFSIIPVGLMMADLLLTYKNKMLVPAVLTGLMSLPLLQMPIAFLQTRITTTPASRIGGQDFGMSLPQMIVNTPREFFSVVFPYVFILTVVGWMQEKSEILNRLLTISIITIILGFCCSMLTPTFPRYFMTVSFIFILSSATVLTNYTEQAGTDRNKLIIYVAVIALLFFLQIGEFISHYTIQQYVC